MCRPCQRKRDSGLARAIKGGCWRRVGVEVFEEAGRRSSLGVDGAPGTGDGGSAIDFVTGAGDTGDPKPDTGGNQVDGSSRQMMN